jgi:hypothetical protein
MALGAFQAFPCAAFVANKYFAISSSGLSHIYWIKSDRNTVLRVFDPKAGRRG